MAERRRDERGRWLSKAPNEAMTPADAPSVRQVQQRKPRADRWTEAGRAKFLLELALTCNVTLASGEAGVSATTAYRHRSQDAGFRRAWRAAIAEGYARLETEMLERALIAETCVRSAIAGADSDAEALALLTKYPSRVAETLYRAHRQTALEEDLAVDHDPDEDATLAALRARIETIRRAVVGGQDSA